MHRDLVLRWRGQTVPCPWRNEHAPDRSIVSAPSSNIGVVANPAAFSKPVDVMANGILMLAQRFCNLAWTSGVITEIGVDSDSQLVGENFHQLMVHIGSGWQEPGEAAV